MEVPSVELLARWQNGDEHAAEALFDRYVQRLRALARRHLPEQFAGRIDADDIVQSVWRCFFGWARRGHGTGVRESRELWNLLAKITVRKVEQHVRRHRRDKRDVARDEQDVPEEKLMGREPTPLEVTTALDLLQTVLRDLNPLGRRVVELCMNGYSQVEIARELGIAERTVRRKLEAIRRLLRQALQTDPAPAPGRIAAMRSVASSQRSRPLPPEIDDLLDRFDMAWQREESPEIAAFLEEVPEGAESTSDALRRRLLVELIAIDLEHRWRRLVTERNGAASPIRDALLLEDYAAQFPELGAPDSLPLALLAEEYRVRHRWGDQPGHAEYLQRFPRPATELAEQLRAVDAELASLPQTPRSKATPASDQAAAAPPPRVGRYELVEKIGSGAFGSVWRARDPELHRDVAVKLPHPDRFADARDRERFLREARSAAQLRHPGIVAVYDVGQEGDRLYLVAELVAGVSLADGVKEHRPAFRETARLVAELADALDAAHAQGVIHRDIKPGNILLQAKSEIRSTKSETNPKHEIRMSQTAARGVSDLMQSNLEFVSDFVLRASDFVSKIADFGLAKWDSGEATVTQDGQLLGTPAYMSPEQFRDPHRVDRRTDLYSLGVILYELLTGELPFRGSARMLAEQVQHEEPRPPRQLHDAIPRDLETIALKCLEKEPDRRYPTARELAADLRRWLAGEPIRARPVGWGGRTLRWARRRPGTAALVATTVSAIVLAFAGVTWKWRDEAAARVGEAAAKEEALASNRRAVETLYGHAIARAARACADQDMELANALLAECPLELRHWEWHHLQRVSRDHRLTIRGHTDGVLCAVYSPDGRRLASAGRDQTVRLWDAGTGTELLTLRGHAGAVRCVAFSPDGLRVASGGEDKVVRVWDATTGREELTLAGHKAAITGVAFHPAGRELASASEDRKVKTWYAATGRPLLTLHGHARAVQSVTYSPDGRQLASASGDRTVKVWDATTGKEHRTLTHRNGVRDVQFSADGRLLASGCEDRAAWLWEAETGKKIHEFRGHEQWVVSVAIHPNGELLVSSGDEGLMRIWDIPATRAVRVLRSHRSGADTVRFSPDGGHLVSSHRDKTLRVWDMTRNRDMVALKGPARARVQGVTFSPDGRRLAACDQEGIVRVWDWATARITLDSQPPGPDVARPRLRSVAYSPDGQRLVAGGEAGTVRVWDPATGKELAPLATLHHYIRSLTFSGEGKYLACGGNNQLLEVWDWAPKTSVLSLRGQGRDVRQVAFRPGTFHLAAASSEPAVRIWDVSTAAEVLCLQHPASTSVACVAYRWDGHFLATGCTDGTVTIWDAVSGEAVRAFPGHNTAVWALAFSPDGKRLVSAGADSTARFWDPATGKELFSLHAHESEVSSLVFSADGRYLATASDGDRAARVWNGAPLAEEGR